MSSKLAYDGGLLKVMRDAIRLPDGGEAWREYVVHPGAVMMLAFLDDETVILERQYRYPHRRHFIELPAGKLEPDEPPLATAKRELVEECGYEADEWWQIATLNPSIGYSSETILLYGARGLRVMLVEQDDLASATSQSSSKLIHGGLRYLEHGEFGLVREALREREVLLRLAPHLVRPLNFVVPHDAAMRPLWMIRTGLW